MSSLLATLALSIVATGAPVSRLAVVPFVIEGQHGAVTISSIFAEVAAAAELRLGLRLLSYEEVFAASRQAIGDRIRDCGSDTRCAATEINALGLGVQAALIVTVDLSSPKPLLNLQLLDTTQASVIVESIDEISESSKLAAEIRARASVLLDRGGYTRAGRVIVEVSPANAHVAITGLEPDPGTPNRFTVAPGKYTVFASLDGYVPAHIEVETSSGAESRAKLELAKEPESIISSPWFWTIIGVVALGAAATSIGFAVGSSGPPCVCLRHDGFCGCPE